MREDLSMDNLELVLDLLEWVRQRPRSYREVMSAWRSTCPRLTVWEDTVDAGYVRVCYQKDTEPLVRITVQGEVLVNANRQSVRSTDT